MVFQLEVYYKGDRLLTGLTAQPKGTTDRWYSNKTSLRFKVMYKINILASPPLIIVVGEKLGYENVQSEDY